MSADRQNMGRPPQDGEGVAPSPETGGGAPGKTLTPAAERALAEASARRAALDARREELARDAELNGRGGLDPVRYEDWEIGGRAVDF